MSEVGCGVWGNKDTEEYFVATKLFQDEYNREIFCNISTNEGRILWLRRRCRDRSV